MRCVAGFHRGGDQVLLVVGDGRSEEKVLTWVAPLFDGSSTSIAYPSPPPLRRRLTGLSALESLIALLDQGFEVKYVLFVLDREHLSSLNEVCEWLAEHGFTVVKEEEGVEGRAARLRLARGHKLLTLYLAIMGRERRLEEEVEEFNVKVLGLRTGRLRKEAFARSTRRDVEECFKALAWALRDIEHRLSQAARP